MQTKHYEWRHCIREDPRKELENKMTDRRQNLKDPKVNEFDQAQKFMDETVQNRKEE